MKAGAAGYTEATQRDISLVQKICQGSSRAFAELVALYGKRISAFGYSFFKNTADAEDFVQEVFIKAYTGIHSFRGESQFATWLMRIAYNTAINGINRRKEYASLSENLDILDTDYGPEEKQLRAATIAAIQQSIKELPENFAVCLDLYFFYDLPYNEISVITGWPINTVKSHIFRAKKLLKQKLTGLHI